MSTSADRPRLDPSTVRFMVVTLTFFGVMAFLFWPLLWGAQHGEPFFYGGHLVDRAWPELSFLCEAVGRGELPWWNPYDGGGYPFASDPHMGAYNPLSWGICGLASMSPSPTGPPVLPLRWLHLLLLVYVLMTGAFAYGWLHRTGASLGGALVGAVFLMCLPLVALWDFNTIAAFTFVPAMLAAGEQWLRRGRFGDGALLSLAIAFCGFSGGPEVFFLGIALLVAVLPVRWVILGNDATAPTPSLVRTGIFSLCVALLLLAPVFVPALELMQRVHRPLRDAASAAGLRALLSPLPGVFYLGLLPFAAFPVLVRALPRRGLFAWGALALVALLATRFAGTSAGIGFVVWLGPIAAFTLSAAITWMSKGGNVIAVPRVLLPLTTLGALFLLSQGFVTVGLTLAAVALIAWQPGSLGKHAVTVAFVVLVVLDLGLAMVPSHGFISGVPAPAGQQADRLLREVPATHVDWRYVDEYALQCGSGSRFGRRELRGHEAVWRLQSWARAMEKMADRPGLLPQYNVRYALQGPHFSGLPDGAGAVYLPAPELLKRLRRARERQEGVIDLPALPFAYFVPQYRITDGLSQERALERVSIAAPAAAAFLEGGTPHEGGPPTALVYAEAERIALHPHHLSFEISPPGDGVVVVNEAYYPDWRAFVDGEPVAIQRANGLMRALPITRGPHHVEMRYAATLWPLFLYGAGWGMLILFGFAQIYTSKRRRSTRP